MDKAYPVTPAVRFLREKGIQFNPHPYAYEERGGTKRSAAELSVDEHAVIKTLVMETDARHGSLDQGVGADTDGKERGTQ